MIGLTTETRVNQSRVQKRRRRSRLLLLSIMIILMLGFLGMGIARAFQNEPPTSQPMIPSTTETPADTAPDNGAAMRPKRFNILVMGVDQRPGDSGRSDTMVVVSVGESGQPMVMSIPRDTRVNIPGHGLDKVNHAYAYGGAELSTKVVSELLGIPLDGYLTANLNLFERTIDLLGGVPMEVEKRMVYVDPDQDLVIDLQPGLQRLDGDKAMQYVRYRSDGLGDLGRIERQQKFLQALAKEAMAPRNVVRLPALVKEIFASVQTNLSLPEVLKALTMGIKSYNNGIKGAAVPGHADYIDGISYYIPDRDALTKIIQESLDY